MSEALKLSVRYDKQPAGLAVTYTVANGHPGPVYLTNHAVKVIAGVGPVPDRDVAFVYFEDGTLHITKRRPRPPGGFFTPREHFVSVVPPHGNYTETFLLPLPVKENIPYRSALPDTEYAGRVLQRVKFSLGYIIGAEHVSAVAGQVGGIDVLALKVDVPESGAAMAPVEERILETAPVELSVDVAVAVGQ